MELHALEKLYLNVKVVMQHVKKLVMILVLDVENYAKMVARVTAVEDVLVDVKRYAKPIVSVIVIQNVRDHVVNVLIHV